MPSTGGTATIRLILELPNEDDLRERYLTAVQRIRQGEDASDALKALELRINRKLGLVGVNYGILDLPSFDFDIAAAEGLEGEELDAQRRLVRQHLRSLVFGLGFDDRGDAHAFMQATARDPDARAGTDFALGPLDNWCPSESSPRLFHHRARAAFLIRAGALGALQGQGVNIVLVDAGYSEARLTPLFPSATLGEGWPVLWLPGASATLPRQPGQALPRSHGTMVGRNALWLAPRSRLFDLPVVPDRITDVLLYANTMLAAYLWVLSDIALRLTPKFPGPWVFCNAWGIYDRRLEFVPGDYTDNPSHLVNLLVAYMDQVQRRDLIFGAGNCGQFCPNERCGPDDRGYGSSILGANSHPGVLTAGAVRADGLWLGYSSQGPGQSGFLPLLPPGAHAVEKPDLCAPSHFIEDDDAFALNGGTSAACGIAAGAVAALRSGGPTATMTPAALRQHLRSRARRLPGPQRPPAPSWDERYGYGILDLG